MRLVLSSQLLSTDTQPSHDVAKQNKSAPLEIHALFAKIPFWLQCAISFRPKCSKKSAFGSPIPTKWAS